MLLPKVGEEYRVKTGYPVDIVVLEVDTVVGSVLFCLAEDGPQKRVSLAEWERMVLRGAVERVEPKEAENCHVFHFCSETCVLTLTVQNGCLSMNVDGDDVVQLSPEESVELGRLLVKRVKG